jgi:predicted amidohydrolase
MARMCTLAARLGTAIGVGGLHPGDDGVLRNVYALIGPDGRLLGLQEKRVPAVGEASEPGTGRLVVGVGGARVGVAICWEVFFPDLVRAAALDGADLILCPAGRVVGPLREQWLAVLRARAIENLCVTATTVNLVGDEPGMCAAYHPEGVLGELWGEGCLVVEVDPERLRLLREADEAIGEDHGFRTIPGLLRAERARCP